MQSYKCNLHFARTYKTEVRSCDGMIVEMNNIWFFVYSGSERCISMMQNGLQGVHCGFPVVSGISVKSKCHKVISWDLVVICVSAVIHPQNFVQYLVTQYHRCYINDIQHTTKIQNTNIVAILKTQQACPHSLVKQTHRASFCKRFL